MPKDAAGTRAGLPRYLKRSADFQQPLRISGVPKGGSNESPFLSSDFKRHDLASTRHAAPRQSIPLAGVSGAAPDRPRHRAALFSMPREIERPKAAGLGNGKRNQHEVDHAHAGNIARDPLRDRCKMPESL